MNFTQEEIPDFLRKMGTQMGTEVFEKYTCDSPHCSIVVSKSEQTGWILSLHGLEEGVTQEELEAAASAAVDELIPDGVSMAQKGSSPFGTVFYQEESDPQ